MPIKTRRLKKADCEVDFFFMGFLVIFHFATRWNDSSETMATSCSCPGSIRRDES